MRVGGPSHVKFLNAVSYSYARLVQIMTEPIDRLVVWCAFQQRDKYSLLELTYAPISCIRYQYQRTAVTYPTVTYPGIFLARLGWSPYCIG